MNKKDIKVEIMRIIGCFGVIAYHTRNISLQPDGRVAESALLIECIFSISLIFFFLINGFYIYKKNNNIFADWYKLILNFIKNFLVPVIIFLFFVIVFDDYIFGKVGIIDSIKNINIINIFKTMLSGFVNLNEQMWPNGAWHLWYVFAYGSIILYYPITRLFLRLDKKIVYSVLMILGVYQIFTDFSILSDNMIFTRFFDFIPRPVIYSAWGHILYNDIFKILRSKSTSSRKKLIIDKKVLVACLSLYIISFVSIYMMEYTNFTAYHTSHTFASWYSFGELMMAIAVETMIYNINVDKIFNTSIKNIIYYIAGTTLGIYILHAPIMLKLISARINIIFNTGINMNPIYRILYLIFYNLFIFMIAFLIVNIWRMCKKKLVCMVRRTR